MAIRRVIKINFINLIKIFKQFRSLFGESTIWMQANDIVHQTYLCLGGPLMLKQFIDCLHFLIFKVVGTAMRSADFFCKGIFLSEWLICRPSNSLIANVINCCKWSSSDYRCNMEEGGMKHLNGEEYEEKNTKSKQKAEGSLSQVTENQTMW